MSDRLAEKIFAPAQQKIIDDIEAVAQAIYGTHRRKPSPSWDETSEEVRDWVRAQALSAINTMRDRWLAAPTTRAKKHPMNHVSA